MFGPNNPASIKRNPGRIPVTPAGLAPARPRLKAGCSTEPSYRRSKTGCEKQWPGRESNPHIAVFKSAASPSCYRAGTAKVGFQSQNKMLPAGSNLQQRTPLKPASQMQHESVPLPAAMIPARLERAAFSSEATLFQLSYGIPCIHDPGRARTCTHPIRRRMLFQLSHGSHPKKCDCTSLELATSWLEARRLCQVS